MCERLSASPANLSILNKFVQLHREDGVDVLDYAKANGSREDKDGILAYYLVKTKSGEGLFFFSLKCGELFAPLTKSVDSILASGEFDLFVRKIKAALETSVEFVTLKDELRTIIVNKRKQMPSKRSRQRGTSASCVCSLQILECIWCISAGTRWRGMSGEGWG